MTALPLLPATQRALKVNQRGLAKVLGTSLRTVQRWSGGAHYPTNRQVHMLARLVYPVDAKLGAQLAVAGATTLEALGLLARPAPPPPPAPPPAPAAPPPRRLPPAASVVDSIVCAAAETMGVMPAMIRPALLAAFVRTGEIGLGVEEVVGALGGKLAPVEASSAAPRSARKGA